MLKIVSHLITAKKGIQYEYSSVQFNLQKNIADKIINWGKNNINDDDIFDELDDKGKPKYGRENQIHCTVLYGIKTTDADDIRKAIVSFRPFEIELSEISCFSSDDKDYDVLKINIKSKKLHELNSLLREKLEYESDYPDYNPHVTISYVKKSSVCQNILDKKFFDGTVVIVDELVFSSSNGTKTKIALKN